MDKNKQFNKRTVEIRVGGRYRLGKKIGAGSFGEIYEGTDLITGTEVAIKLELKSSKHPQLLSEAKLLKSISGKGVPTMHWFGEAGDFYSMVMDLLGQNLEDLFDFCGRNFTLKTILLCAMGMIERIKHLHDHNFVHRDIKPENFLVGKTKNDQMIYLIDFGLAKRYRDDQTKIHVPFKENKNLTGTARYASRHALKGKEESRRDDLESIGYVLIYLIKGSLPWQGLKCKDKDEKYRKIKEMKEKTTPEELCQGLPIQFKEYLEYCFKLQYDDEPNYKYLYNLFRDFYKKKEYDLDYIYDWITVKNNTRVLKEASLCQSDEYTKAQNRIEQKNFGEEL